MKIALIMLFPFLALLFSNCSSSSQLINQHDRISINEDNISRIEGFYKNSSDSLSNNVNLWRELKPFPKVKDLGIISDTSNIIGIKLIEDEIISFSLFVNDTLYDTKEIKYELQNGVIMIKSMDNMRYWGIPFIIFQHTHENINLGIDENNNLIVAHSGKAGGGIFIIISGTDTYGYNRLQKIQSLNK